MHHYKGPKGTIFNFNSDMSGEVIIAGYTVADDDGSRIAVNGEDLIAFATHWLANYKSDESEDDAIEDEDG